MPGPLRFLNPVVLAGGAAAPIDEGPDRICRTGKTRAEARANISWNPHESPARPAAGWSTAGEGRCRIGPPEVRHEASHRTAVASCDVYRVPRGFLGHGIHWDYLSIDADRRLLGFVGRFVD